MPNKVFKDPQLEKDFNEKGYVSLPFLNEEEVAFLKDKFFETIHESGGPKKSGNVDYDSKSDISYDFTFIDNNIEYKKKVFEIITDLFQEKVDIYLNNYTPIIANYIRKKEGGGEVPMHQNWAFVDEEKYTSVSVWVPLVDSNEENGTLQMVDGSHKRFGKHRGPMIPWELRNLKEEIVKNHLTPMNVKAGRCVILDDSIVHYSDINKTPGLRLTIQLIMIPAEAHSIHYHLDRDVDPNKISVLQTNVDFYTNFHPWLKPTGMPVLKTIDFVDKIFTYPDFLAGLKAERFDDPDVIAANAKPIAPLFLDSALQEKFEQDGFVKIPLLNDKEVEDLINYYHSLNHEHIGASGFHVTLDSRNEDYISGVFKKLFSTIMPKLDPYLVNYKAFTASYVIKEVGMQNMVPPHQDWSFVDEEEFCSATVWIPLMDVNKSNGALGVIKGSHKLFNYPRASPSPQAKSILSEHIFTLFPYIRIIDMFAGEALIFNNKTIHASPPNVTGTTRIGAGIGITQSNAQLLHYYQVPDTDNIEVYKVDKNFFKKYNNAKLAKLYNDGMKPYELEKYKTIPKPKVKYTGDEMVNMVCSTEGVMVNFDLMHELSALYNSMDKSQQRTETMTKKITTVKTEIRSSVVNHFVREDIKEHLRENVKIISNEKKSFFKTYTPKNILAEIKYRLKRKKNK